MRVFAFSLFIGIGALIATSGISAQRASVQPLDAATVRAANNRFAGTWQLISEETRDSTGQVVSRRPDATTAARFGYIAYDPAGYVSVTIAWPDRPTIANREPTPQEALASLGTYNSYWGSFAVREADSIVTHQIMGAISPAFSGSNQDRGFTISGTRLRLRTSSAANGDEV